MTYFGEIVISYSKPLEIAWVEGWLFSVKKKIRSVCLLLRCYQEVTTRWCIAVLCEFRDCGAQLPCFQVFTYTLSNWREPKERRKNFLCLYGLTSRLQQIA